MLGRAGRLLIVILLIAGCTTHRVFDNRAKDQVANCVSLHGFFGSRDDLGQVRELIPLPGATTPLPTCWNRNVPLETFGGQHRPLYLDPSLIRSGTGADDQCPKGLECSTLAFYTGHGTINSWNVPNNQVLLSQVKAGDGLLRYFWLYSCNVLAHGPQIHGDYPLPQRFRCGDADVFQRWTPAFGPHLRMVCGGSTQLGFAHVGEVWNYLLEEEKPVSEAFVLGVAQPGQVPACLARGGSNPDSPALADRTLLPGGVENAGPKWLHFQYSVACKVVRSGSTLSVQCGEPPTPSNWSPAPEIETLPRVTTVALPPPVPPVAGRLPLGFVPLPGGASKYHPDSGAVVLIKSDDQYTPLDPCDQVTTWTVNPPALLAQKGLKPGLLPFSSPNTDSTRKFSDEKITALELRVESRQDRAPVEDRKCWGRSLFVRFDSEVDIGTKRLPIFGPAIILEISRGENMELASFSAPQRELAVLANQLSQDHRIKPSKAVIREARQELRLDPETYPVRSAQAILGYEEAPLRCLQAFLRPTYEIRFVPTAAAAPNYPTVIVRRDARINPHDEGWTCQGWGDFPPPEP
jgi:hypothetical protein